MTDKRQFRITQHKGSGKYRIESSLAAENKYAPHKFSEYAYMTYDSYIEGKKAMDILIKEQEQDVWEVVKDTPISHCVSIPTKIIHNGEVYVAVYLDNTQGDLYNEEEI